MSKTPFAIAALVLLLGGALAGCDSNDSGSALPSSGASASRSSAPVDGTEKKTSDDPDDMMLNYVKCLRDNGVDVSDPTSDGGLVLDGIDTDSAAFKAAESTCAKVLESAVKSGVGTGPDAAMTDALLKMASCMREKGHDFEDPTTSSDGRVSLPMPKDPSQADAWNADLATCSAGMGQG